MVSEKRDKQSKQHTPTGTGDRDPLPPDFTIHNASLPVRN
jgi:hypothetical protein